jgi:UPF0755 protein
MRASKGWLLGLLGVGLAAAAGAAFLSLTARAMRVPGPAASAVRVSVPSGTSVRGVLETLEAHGVLRNAWEVGLYLRSRGRRVNFKAGQYEFPARATAAEVLQQIEEGRVVLAAVTVVEGWTFASMRRAIEATPDLAQTLAGKSDALVMEAIGHPGEYPEGRFFPDTYRFAAGTADREVYALAYRQMSALLAADWADRTPDLPLHSAYEALILASIVEKESARVDERARIAGVFIARLRRGMRLQTDPTVIYGLGSAYDGRIHDRDLRTDTPYNTYARAGLPPTPIALPGREALQASVHPELTGALYFVATGEGDGSHHFSATLEEHNLAVQRYLARLRTLSTARQAPAASAP